MAEIKYVRNVRNIRNVTFLVLADARNDRNANFFAVGTGGQKC